MIINSKPFKKLRKYKAYSRSDRVCANLMILNLFSEFNVLNINELKLKNWVWLITDLTDFSDYTVVLVKCQASAKVREGMDWAGS